MKPSGISMFQGHYQRDGINSPDLNSLPIQMKIDDHRKQNPRNKFSNLKGTESFYLDVNKSLENLRNKKIPSLSNSNKSLNNLKINGHLNL